VTPSRGGTFERIITTSRRGDVQAVNDGVHVNVYVDSENRMPGAPMGGAGAVKMISEGMAGAMPTKSDAAVDAATVESRGTIPERTDAERRKAGVVMAQDDSDAFVMITVSVDAEPEARSLVMRPLTGA